MDAFYERAIDQVTYYGDHQDPKYKNYQLYATVIHDLGKPTSVVESNGNQIWMYKFSDGTVSMKVATMNDPRTTRVLRAFINPGSIQKLQSDVDVRVNAETHTDYETRPAHVRSVRH